MLEPLFDNLVVKAEEANKAVGGIELPDTIDPDAPQIGTVSGAGSEAKYVKVGDKVVFRKYAPDSLTMDGEKLLLVAEKDITAIIR